jgi:adenylate cyclase
MRVTRGRHDNAFMELRHATVLFADLRSFSTLLACSAPATVFAALNRWFVRMSEVAAANGGTIDSFIGDAIMVLFDEARHGVACAVDMQLAMEDINRAQREAGLPDLYMGIGVNSGEVIAGVLGSSLHSARTVIGEEVNLAARIEAFCLRGQILISEATRAKCQGFVETGQRMDVHIKGRSSSVVLHEVHGIPSAEKRVPRLERRRSPRVPVRIPFSYQLLGNDMVSPVRAPGTILDIGYRSMLVELERELGLFHELKLEVDLPFSGHRTDDLYGRIVNAQPGGRRYGIEFTALGTETGRQIQALVQFLIQGAGAGAEHRFPL